MLIDFDNINYNDIKSVNDIKSILESKEYKPKTGDDKLNVEYASLSDYNNIFKHIIIFTNNRDPEKNKTLANVYDAIKNLKENKCKIIPKLHVFIAEDMSYVTNEDNVLSISDGKENYEFSDESNSDTLVFSRLGVQGEDQCENIVKLLQDRGFLVINSVRPSEIASDKYETATLLEKAGLPQPRFCLMDKDILYNEEQYLESMQRIYPDWSKKSDENEDKELVVKVLDGHGGTGVFMSNGKRLYAILQAIFYIDPHRRLILQRKEEIDGGDIRVHVLTLKNRQKILACMKREQLKGDFRSNISLGASAKQVKLTPAQEQLALQAAKISKLVWCAVDIAPIKKGSNKELGENAILELNCSPGTWGISDIIGFNLINVILNELSNPKEFFIQDKTAGYLEAVEIDMGKGPIKLLAKLDTGNSAIASHLEVGEMDIDGDYVKFKLEGQEYKFKIDTYSKAQTGNVINNRPVIVVNSVKLGQRKINNVPMALVKERSNKSSNALLNRELMSWLGYIVSPSQTHLLTSEIERVNIIQ